LGYFREFVRQPRRVVRFLCLRLHGALFCAGFPKGNQTTQLLQTAAVFAIGFLMRPVGGYVFGFVADKYGRKNSMMISVLICKPGDA
jgi:MFS family permease